MNETPNLWPHAWSLIRGQQRAAWAGLVLTLLVISAVRGGLGAWGTTYLVRAGLWMTQELRFRVYEHLQKLSLVFHDSRAVGDSIYRVTWDTYSIQTIFNGGLIPLVSAIATLIGMMIIMLRFDVVLTLLALAVAPALALTIKHYNRLMTNVSTEYHTRESKVSAMIQESLSAIRTIQAFAREEDEVRRFGANAAQSVDANVRMTKV